jgi:cyanocobalamin reductase (cyanide-eliminating) / alkylcobalamin dealkylase
VTSGVVDTDAIATRCASVGLDLSAVTSVGSYNELVDEPYRLPGAAASTVLVLGNTRALWAHLERFVHEGEPSTDPVDTYVERCVRAATADVVDIIDIRYSHEPPPRRIAIQRLADRAGLAWLSPSHLCVHPVYGPWIALRAAVVLERPLTASPSAAVPPCECAVHCLPKLQEAIAAGEPADAEQMVAHWERWLAMRDACPIGHEHRYTTEQIRYHYLGERPMAWPLG